MAYVLGMCDGLDHYDPGGTVLPWAVRHGTVGTVAGPYHGQAAVFAQGGAFYERAAFGAFTSQGVVCNLRVRASGWGATARVVPVQFWLFDDELKQTLVLHHDGRVSVHQGDEDGAELCTSEAGAFPFDTWVALHYSTSLSEEAAGAAGPGGRADVFLDGVGVASATGIPTTEAPALQSHFCLGNCLDDGNAVRVEADDVADYFTFATGAPEPEPPPGRGPHGVYTLRPVAEGDRTQLGVGAGVGENWQVNADALGDFDASHVVKAAGGDTGDLYRLAPWPEALPLPPADGDAPAYFEWGGQAWGLARDDGGTFRRGSLLLRYTDGFGDEYHFSNRVLLPVTGYRYAGNQTRHDQASLASVQLGWGMAPGDLTEAEADAFAGSQVCLCVWYPDPVPWPPPPVGGARRWRVQWIAEA